MDTPLIDQLTEVLPVFLLDLWDLVSDPVLRRQYGVDKILHFSLSFLMATCIALPIIRWKKVDNRWVWAVLIPGAIKEVWDFYKKVYIHSDWAHYPEVFVDSLWDMVFDVLGIFVAYLLFCRRKKH